MNGEIYNACSIVTAAKKALRESQNIDYKLDTYEKHIEFHFLPKGLFRKKRQEALSVDIWFKECLSAGLEDIKFMTPDRVKDRHLLGFSGATLISILCFYKNGKTTYFTPHWSFVERSKGWHIVYEENLWKIAPSEKPQFTNPTFDFLHALEEIEAFARVIEFPYFAEKFLKASQILLGNELETTTPHPDLPPENLKLFLAAQNAYVFGAMGSWNDSPPYVAHEKGLEKQYEALSAQLHTQIVSAILYAVNQW